MSVSATVVAVGRRSTVYEKIVAAIRESGYDGSLRTWFEEAGLSESYLSRLKVRCEENPSATIRANAAELIAAKLGISVENLMATDRKPVRYESLAAAIGAARALGFSEEAIRVASTGSAPEDDPGRLWWFRRIEAEEERLRDSRPSSVMRSLQRE